MKNKLNPKVVWLIWASAISLLVIITYISLHIVKKGQEGIILSGEQLSAINSIISNENDSASSSRLITKYMEEIFILKDKSELTELFEIYNNKQLISILPSYPFKVESFFWLSGPFVLLEIVFWSLFGLMAHLMYGVTTAKEFDKSRVPEHIGKIFYTPFLILVIYLSLNALVNSGSISLAGVGKSVVVMSFILGFFTKRSINLLTRIRDLILPTIESKTQKEDNVEIKRSYEIKGTVSIDQLTGDLADKNLQYITMKISSTESGYTYVFHPDNTGAFVLKDLSAGIYSIDSEVVIENIRYSDVSQIQLFGNQEISDVQITLKKDDLIIK